MSLNKQANTVTKKCFGVLSKLYSIKHVLSKTNRSILIKACLLSVLNYCSLIWLSSNTRTVMQKYDKILRCASRFIQGKRKFDPISIDICNTLGFLFADYRYLYELLIFTYKCTYLMNTGYYNNYIDFSYRTTQSTRNNTFTCPCLETKSKWGKYSLKYAAVNAWLNLTPIVRNSVCKLATLKKSVYMYCMNLQKEKYLYNINDDDDDDCNYDINILFEQ